MIHEEDGAAHSFGDRVRLSRQRLRTSLGRRWTQGDLAAAVGVERNTVSRWENGGVLPKDPAILAGLARALRVTTDWLLDGLSPNLESQGGRDDDGPSATREIHEGRGIGGYRLDPAVAKMLAPVVTDVVRGYLRRMSDARCSANQVRGAEAMLLAGATEGVSRVPFADRGEAELLADVDAAWDFVVKVLRREGIRL